MLGLRDRHRRKGPGHGGREFVQSRKLLRGDAIECAVLSDDVRLSSRGATRWLEPFKSCHRLGALMRETQTTSPVLASVLGTYEERVPRASLREHFSCTWFHALPVGARSPIAVVPDGRIDLQWIDGVLLVAGPDREVKRESPPPGATVIGLRFFPGAAYPWLRAPASEIVGARTPLDAFWGAEARRIAEWAGAARDALGVARRLEVALSLRARDLPRPDPAAEHVLRVLDSERVRESEVVLVLRTELCLSERTLRRRCHEMFGYGPKTLQRVIRFQRFLRLAHRGDHIAGIAAEAGYSDQAHLTREARRMAAMTPATILAQLAQ